MRANQLFLIAPVILCLVLSIQGQAKANISIEPTNTSVFLYAGDLNVSGDGEQEFAANNVLPLTISRSRTVTPDSASGTLAINNSSIQFSASGTNTGVFHGSNAVGTVYFTVDSPTAFLLTGSFANSNPNGQRSDYIAALWLVGPSNENLGFLSRHEGFSYDANYSDTITAGNTTGVVAGTLLPATRYAYYTELNTFDNTGNSTASATSTTTLALTPLPEPASAALLGAGALLLITRRRAESRLSNITSTNSSDICQPRMKGSLVRLLLLLVNSSHLLLKGSITRRRNNMIATVTVLFGLLGSAQASLTLLVASSGTNQVLRYDGTTGAPQGMFASGGGLDTPWGMTYGPDGNLYVSSFGSDQVLRYNGITGAFINSFATVAQPYDLTFGPDDDLYVASQQDRAIVRINGITGTSMGAFTSSLGDDVPISLAFHNGDLYVSRISGTNPGDVLRYNGSTGAYIGIFATGFDGNGPRNPVWGSDGNLYVSDYNETHVVEYNGLTGSFIGVFASGGTLSGPGYITFGPDGYLYVTSTYNSEVVRFDGTTGVFLDAFVPSGGGNLQYPVDALFTSAPLAIPEPASAALLGAGAVLLLRRRRRAIPAQFAAESNASSNRAPSRAPAHWKRAWCSWTAAGIAIAMAGSVEASPISQFTINPNPAAPNHSLSFDGSTSSDTDPLRSITNYFWDFGDGNTASGATSSINHPYTFYGTYSSALTVTNDLGQTAQTTHDVFINQGDTPPVAIPGGPYTVALGQSLQLSGSASDPDVAAGDSVVSYAWDLGNGIGAFHLSGANPVVTASMVQALGVGAFPLVLQVTDTFSLTGSSSTVVSITNPVPEPASAALLGVGALWMSWRPKRTV